MKERYDELGDYTEAFQHKSFAVAEAQLARMKREFARSKLSESSRLSYNLFEWLVVNQRRLTRWGAVSPMATCLQSAQVGQKRLGP